MSYRKGNGQSKSATISKTSSGKYFVAILSEKEYKPVKKTNKKNRYRFRFKRFPSVI